MRPSRRGWHMDAIMPGMTPGEEIDVVVSIDMSGSISNKQAQQFLGEIGGMMDSFDGYKVHVFCFDTDTYNPQDFSSENMDSIEEYQPMGGGGTDFDAIFRYLKDNAIDPKRLIVFTDGYPCGSWGDPDYCDTTWIIHGDPNPNPPFGTYAIYDEKWDTMSWLDYIILALFALGLIYLFIIALNKFLGMIKDVDD